MYVTEFYYYRKLLDHTDTVVIKLGMILANDCYFGFLGLRSLESFLEGRDEATTPANS